MQNPNLGPFVKVRNTIDGDGNRFARYDGGAYILTISGKESFHHLQILHSADAPKYTPDIYVRCDDEYKPIGVEIQTTSYGALSPSETEQVIHGLKHAVYIAGAIQEKFIGLIRAGNFVFGDMITQEKEEGKC